jgi:3-oxoacyl-[acyl-carrier protein] reductase
MTTLFVLAPTLAGSVAYAATKAALDAFTITFADEVEKYGITVNAVDPGPTDTGVDDSGKAARTAFTTSPRTIGVTGRGGVVGRFLASSEADWITGQTIRSRGGFW